MEHFFPRIQVQTCAKMHIRVKLLEGMQMKTILKLLGGTYPPHPPLVSAPLKESIIALKLFAGLCSFFGFLCLSGLTFV